MLSAREFGSLSRSFRSFRGRVIIGLDAQAARTSVQKRLETRIGLVIWNACQHHQPLRGGVISLRPLLKLLRVNSPGFG